MSGGPKDYLQQHWAEAFINHYTLAMERPILVKRLDPRAVIPELAKPGDVGFDLVCLDGGVVPAGGYASFHSGVAIKLPDHLWAMVVGRSSTWRSRGLIATQGIIDSGYTGELLSGVFNPRPAPIEVPPGARLKQVLIIPALRPIWLEVDELPETARGASGFGSTG